MIVYRAGSTPEVFPGGVTAEQLEELRVSDPDLAREYAGEWFDASASAFVEPAALDLVTRRERDWIPRPSDAGPAVASIDPAFAPGGDAFALAVGWRAADGRAVIAGVESWAGGRSGLSLDGVADAVAARCREYDVGRVVTDQGYAGPVIEALGNRSLAVVKRPVTADTRWAMLSGLRLAINTERVELPLSDALRRELLSLVLVAGRAVW